LNEDVSEGYIAKCIGPVAGLVKKVDLGSWVCDRVPRCSALGRSRYNPTGLIFGLHHA
jgi:hypothetical protein